MTHITPAQLVTDTVTTTLDITSL